MNSNVFKALGNETRLKIIQTLMIREHNVTDLTQISGKDQTTVSRHLSTLVNNKIIKHKRIFAIHILFFKLAKLFRCYFWKICSTVSNCKNTMK